MQSLQKYFIKDGEGWGERMRLDELVGLQRQNRVVHRFLLLSIIQNDVKWVVRTKKTNNAISRWLRRSDTYNGHIIHDLLLYWSAPRNVRLSLWEKIFLFFDIYFRELFFREISQIFIENHRNAHQSNKLQYKEVIENYNRKT